MSEPGTRRDPGRTAPRPRAVGPVARVRALSRWDWLIAAVLGVAYVAILVNSVGELGYARDEGFYFHAASSYGRWLTQLWDAPGQALSRRAVDGAWANNHEHPALVKTLFALSNLLLQKKLHLFAMEGTSYRFPAMVLGGGLVSLVYAWGAQVRSRAAGLVAAVLFAAMPRVFYHAHLACFDVPIVAIWTLCAYTYWRAVCTGGDPASGGQRGSGAGEGGRLKGSRTSGDSGGQGAGGRGARGAGWGWGWGWPLLVGLTFGLALDTKHNSWFLPIVAGAHAAALVVASRLLPEGRLRDRVRAQVGRAARALAAMALIGPVVLVALWPWLWHDTLPRWIGYAKFHLQHEYYNMEFLGENYWTPPMPRGYAFLMTAATVPLVTLLLFAAGLAGRARLRLGEVACLLAERWRARGPSHGQGSLGRWLRAGVPARVGPGAGAELLWLLSIGAIYAAWLSPGTPIFGGTKHWMTAYPFLALFAGLGFDDVVRAARAAVLRAVRRRRVAGGGVSSAGAMDDGARAPAGERPSRTTTVNGSARRGGAAGAAVRAARSRWALAAVLGGAVLVSPVVQSARSHPWGLSSYTPLVGGAAGAATLGLNRTFWGYTTGAVAPYLNEAPPGAAVFVHDTAGASWDMLLADGRVRKDLRGVWSVDPSAFAIYHHEKHMLGVEYQTWVAYGTVRPDFIAGLDGVPVVWVYRRPARRP